MATAPEWAPSFFLWRAPALTVHGTSRTVPRVSLLGSPVALAAGVGRRPPQLHARTCTEA